MLEREQQNIMEVVFIRIIKLVICLLKVGKDGRVVNKKSHVSPIKKILLS